jgi:hypothetical protein
MWPVSAGVTAAADDETTTHVAPRATLPEYGLR